ncbi:MAG: TolC family protein [Phycisphaerales bacterium]
MIAALTTTIVSLAACQNGLERIDQHANELIDERMARLGEENPQLPPDRGVTEAREESYPLGAATDYTPDTINPPADDLEFERRDPERNVAELLDKYTELDEDAPRFDLEATLGYAVGHSREYLVAKEDLFIAALRLLAERHRFGPRFFDEVSATLDANLEDGDYDTALRLVNEFGVRQQLKTGGSIAATAVVQSTEQLRQVVSDSTSQSASVILSADIPLLRGSGFVAQESLISAERQMIYATRAFERFRRNFLFDIAVDYFDLVQAAAQIEIAERVLEQRIELERETRALFDAGRRAEFEMSEARQRVLDGVNALANQRDRYILQLERFRIRLGLPPDAAFLIDSGSTYEIPVPQLDMMESVRRAWRYRLDLQTTRDRVADSRRAVGIARNSLLPDFDLTASAEFVTDPDLDRAGLQFDLDETDLQAGLTFGVPLDRRLERISLREAMIDLERAVRSLRENEDTIALNVRAAIRDIQLAIFSLQLQSQNVSIIERRIYGLELRQRDVSTRTIIDAQDELDRALNQLEAAKRDLRVAILRFLLETGQFRVGSDGELRLPPSLAPSRDPNDPDPWGIGELGLDIEIDLSRYIESGELDEVTDPAGEDTLDRLIDDPEPRIDGDSEPGSDDGTELESESAGGAARE